ncbi:hypothetical protein TNCV_1155981 [Trichonephila clavipes]|nr:hypothetical protein TNCV_1155981 [Trichonephila clavipes]
MEIPLRTAYGQAGRCDMQPKPSSLRAQAHQSKSRTETEKGETLEKKLGIRAEREREKGERESFRYARAPNPGLSRLQAELAERWTELPLRSRVLDESRSFFRVHTGYFSNIPKCIKAEFIASWGCSQSSVVSSSKR